METYGFDELINAIENLGQGFEEKSNTLLEEIGDTSVSEIQERTPVKSGALKRSISRGNIEGSGIDKKIEIGSNIQYATLVENGHRTTNGGFVAGHFMIKDGFTSVKPQFKSKCDELLSEIVGDLKL